LIDTFYTIRGLSRQKGFMAQPFLNKAGLLSEQEGAKRRRPYEWIGGDGLTK
jgi:hypothetical protein